MGSMACPAATAVGAGPAATARPPSSNKRWPALCAAALQACCANLAADAFDERDRGLANPGNMAVIFTHLHNDEIRSPTTCVIGGGVETLAGGID